MSAYTWAWLAWALAFVIVEGMALFNSRRGDTLSEHVWAWLGSAHLTRKQPTGWTRLRRFVVLAGLAWVVAHFLTGGFF